MSQYTSASGLPSSTYRDLVLSYVGMFDHYVLYQTAQYEYTGYVWNRWGKRLKITIYREANGDGYYNYRWRSDVQEDATVAYQIYEPMYAYSTETGEGVYYMPETHQATMATACLITCCIIAVILMWKRVFLWRN